MDEIVIKYKTYLEALKKSPHTVKQYCIDTQQFITFMKEAHFTFGDSIKKVIISYNEYLQERFSSISSINRKRASLHHFLNFLLLREIIREIPESLLKPLKLETKQLQILSTNQVKSVLNFWFEAYQSTEDVEYKWLALRNFCLVNMIFELGVKPYEIIALKWRQIKGNEISISQKHRKLSLSDSLCKWLDLYQYETENIFPTNHEFVWLGLGNKQNDPITVKTIERIFQSISKGLGFKVTATTLRYTCIHTEYKQIYDEQLTDLYTKYGYSRKSVLLERVRRFK
ncbi:MAG TPA: site-specific integrase [Ureibacillus sp.]|nr:site-specific integrase [Ureibacillus sp.]